MSIENKREAKKATPVFTKKWAEFWRVTQRTIQRWSRNADIPRVDDVASMIRWAAGPERKPRAFLRRVAELRIEREGKNPTPTEPPSENSTNGKGSLTGNLPAHTDADWAEFERDGAPAADPREQLQTLERFRDYYAFKLRKANRLNDENAIRNFSDLVIKYEKAIRDNKLAADRLGIEAGDLLPRAAHEQIISAHAFFSMRAIDLALDSLARRLINLSFPEEARAVLEPVLLNARFFAPLVHSARTAATNALPAWFVDRYVETIDDYLENGRALAQAAFSAPQPNTFTEGGGI